MLQFGASQLADTLAAYRTQLAKSPPSSPEALLQMESGWLTSVMAGIGLDPEKAPAPAPQAPAGKPTAAVRP